MELRANLTLFVHQKSSPKEVVKEPVASSSTCHEPFPSLADIMEAKVKRAVRFSTPLSGSSSLLDNPLSSA